MTIRCYSSNWEDLLRHPVETSDTQVRIVCPFLKKAAVERLLDRTDPGPWRVITRFNLDDLKEEVSDIAALRLLLQRGARIRGVQDLHTKLYIFGEDRAVVTSANLTNAGMNRNHEFGCLLERRKEVRESIDYFERMWEACSQDLTRSRLADIVSRLPPRKRRGKSGGGTGEKGCSVYSIQAYEKPTSYWGPIPT